MGVRSPLRGNRRRSPRLQAPESELEATLAQHLTALKFPPWEREYRFHPIRKFRLDFAWPALRVAVECQGGIWNQGAHGRGSGIERDCEKLALAAALGWRVIPVAGTHIEAGVAVEWIRLALEWEKA